MLKNDSLPFRNEIKMFMDVILEIVTSSLNVIWDMFVSVVS